MLPLVIFWKVGYIHWKNLNCDRGLDGLISLIWKKGDIFSWNELQLNSRKKMQEALMKPYQVID